MKPALTLLTLLSTIFSITWATVLNNYQRLNAHVVLYWDFPDPETAIMALKFDYFGWVGIGFGDVMANCDMILVETKNNQITLSDLWSTGENHPPPDTAHGGTNDLSVNETAVVNGSKIVIFTRKLNTGDPYDAVLSQGVFTLTWAATTKSSMEDHGPSYGQLDLHFVQGWQSDDYSNLDPDLRSIHAILNVIVWGILLDFGIFMIRHGRGKYGYITIHGIGMFIFSMATLFFSVWIWVRILSRSILITSGNQAIHWILGTGYIVLILVQALIGIVNRYKLVSTTFTNSILTTKKTHMYLGYFLWLMCKIEVLIGAIQYSSTILIVVVVIWYPVLVISLAAMEYYWGRHVKHPNSKRAALALPPPSKEALNLSQQQLMEKLLRNESHENIRKTLPNMRWALLGNKVLDLTNFDHPDGNYILEFINGRELGRFLHGSFGLEAIPERHAHDHTFNAFSWAAKMQIGELVSTDDNILRPAKGSSPTSSEIWKLVEEEGISSSISRYDFTCPSYNIKLRVKGVNWFGRHFNISNSNNKTPTRQYSTALCMFPSRVTARAAMVEVFEGVLQNKSVQTTTQGNTYETNKLSCFIKNYKQVKGLSTNIALALSNKEANFMIEGPIGEGLGLLPNSNGEHYVFCAGTGVLPLLDFLNFYLERLMYRSASASIGKDRADSLFNSDGEDFIGAFGAGFKVSFFGAFRLLADFIGADIVQKLAQYSKQLKLDAFRAYVKITEAGQMIPEVENINGRFDSQLLNQLVTANGEKYYICGPPGFNNMVFKTLLGMGVPRTRIHMV